MLLSGMIESIPSLDEMFIYTLTTHQEGYPSVDILPNLTEISNNLNGLDFDIFFANYILNNDMIFYEFFSKIIYPLYIGHNVFLVISEFDILYDVCIESLLKFIQQRYGYTGSIINEPDDVYYINESSFGSTGLYGLTNLDIDKERYSELYVRFNGVGNL